MADNIINVFYVIHFYIQIKIIIIIRYPYFFVNYILNKNNNIFKCYYIIIIYSICIALIMLYSKALLWILHTIQQLFKSGIHQ